MILQVHCNFMLLFLITIYNCIINNMFIDSIKQIPKGTCYLFTFVNLQFAMLAVLCVYSIVAHPGSLCHAPGE